MPPEPPAVTVVIPTKGRPVALAASLAAVVAAAERLAQPVEVFVLDDGSDERTRAVVAAVVAGAGCAVVYVPAHDYGGRGQGDARNAGVARAGADIVAFTDDDTRCAPDWLSRAVGRLRAEPALAGLEGLVRPHATAGADTARARVVSNLHGRGFLTANLVLRRSAFLRAGGVRRLRADGHPRWDHSFREDTDLALRVERYAGPVVFDPALVVEHPVDAPGLRAHLRTATFFEVDEAFRRLHPGAFPSLRAQPFARLRIRSAVLAVLSLPLVLMPRARRVALVAPLAAAAVQQLQVERDLRRALPERRVATAARDVVVRTPRCVAWAVLAGAARTGGALATWSGRTPVRRDDDLPAPGAAA